MNNLYKQITRNDTSAGSVKTVNVPVRKLVDGKFTFENKNISYVTIVDDETISNIGYCCNTDGIQYPIILDDNFYFTSERGMYEVKDISISKVAVPNLDFDFSFDFVCEMS